LDCSFPKSSRLLTAEQFRRVYSGAEVLRGRQIQLLYSRNGLRYPRFGISVGRKVGKAVRRNRLRRRIREAIRLNRARLAVYGVDVVVHPRPAAASLGSQLIFSELHRLLQHLTRTLGTPQERRTQHHSLLQAVCFAASTSSLPVLANLLGIFLSSHQ
jgi:ribonuclease P protein component